MRMFQSTLKAHKKAQPFLLLEIWILSGLPRNINNLSPLLTRKEKLPSIKWFGRT
jgi:hypothetical protein